MDSKKFNFIVVFTFAGICTAGLLFFLPSIKALSPMFLSALVGKDDYETRRIPAASMEPTLQVNDRLLIDKNIYQRNSPQRGDIILFNPTEVLRQQNYNVPFIKRVVGLPGESVEIKQGRVLIDNHPIEENYILEPPEYTMELRRIPDGAYFVLGDSRNNSYDSHYWGYVAHDLIIGKAVSIYFPTSRASSLDVSK